MELIIQDPNITELTSPSFKMSSYKSLVKCNITYGYASLFY